MFYKNEDGNKAKLECTLFILAISHLVCVFLSIWIVLVTLTLLYALGFRPAIPSPTFGAAFLAGFVAAWVLFASVVSVLIILYSWYRRKRPARETGPRNAGSTAGLCKAISGQRTSLMRCCSDIERLVNLDTLMPILCRNGVLNTEEVSSLVNSRAISGSTRSYQVLHFVTILDKKGEKGFEGVVQALKEDKEHLGHEELADILADRYDNTDHHNKRRRMKPSVYNV